VVNRWVSEGDGAVGRNMEEEAMGWGWGVIVVVVVVDLLLA